MNSISLSPAEVSVGHTGIWHLLELLVEMSEGDAATLKCNTKLTVF